MKRALVLSTIYPNAAHPRFGTFVARSMEAVAALGQWEVTVVNPIGLPPFATQFGARYAASADAAVGGVEGGVRVHRPTFPLIPKIGGRFNPWLIARTVRPLVRRLHAERPFDLVDAQFFWPDGPAAARLARALGLPLSIKARGADIHYWGGKRYARRAMRRSARRAAGLLAVSEALADDMAKLGMARDKITIHRTGLDRDRFRPLDHPQLRARLSEAIGVSIGSEPLLATVGALIARKGQALVIEALAGLPDARLLLVGEGPDKAKLRGLAARLGVAGRVHFLGSVDHDLLPVILSAADAMVLPSASEGLANAWVEALACGTPLVITDAGGAREVMTSRDAGLIVERSASGVAQGVAAMLADPPPCDATAAMADRFGWDAHAERLTAYWDGLTSGGVARVDAETSSA